MQKPLNVIKASFVSAQGCWDSITTDTAKSGQVIPEELLNYPENTTEISFKTNKQMFVGTKHLYTYARFMQFNVSHISVYTTFLRSVNVIS